MQPILEMVHQRIYDTFPDLILRLIYIDYHFVQNISMYRRRIHQFELSKKFNKKIIMAKKFEQNLLLTR